MIYLKSIIENKQYCQIANNCRLFVNTTLTNKNIHYSTWVHIHACWGCTFVLHAMDGKIKLFGLASPRSVCLTWNWILFIFWCQWDELDLGHWGHTQFHFSIVARGGHRVKLGKSAVGHWNTNEAECKDKAKVTLRLRWEPLHWKYHKFPKLGEPLFMCKIVKN